MILKSILKQGSRTFLIILQLVIGLTTLSIGLGMIEGTQRLINDVKELAPQNMLHIGMYVKNRDLYTEQHQAFESIDSKFLLKLYSDMKNDNRITNLGTFIVKQGMNSNGLEIMEISIDVNYLKMCEFKVVRGRKLSVNDFSEKSDAKIPVLISKELSEAFPLGSTYNQVYRVVGILPANTKFWGGSSTLLSSNLINSNNIIIIPLKENQFDKDDIKTRVFQNMLFQVKDVSQKIEVSTYILQRMKGEINKVGLDVKITDLSTEIADIKKRNEFQTEFSLIFAVLILILSSFGLIGVTLASIARRRSEFGMRYALGSTPRLLVALICGEIAFLYFISIIIAIFISIVSQSLFKAMLIEIGITTIIKAVGITLLLSVLSCFLPVLKIIKTKPVELISGG